MKVIPEKLEDPKDVFRSTEIQWPNAKGQKDNVTGHISVPPCSCESGQLRMKMQSRNAPNGDKIRK